MCTLAPRSSPVWCRCSITLIELNYWNKLIAAVHIPTPQSRSFFSASIWWVCLSEQMDCFQPCYIWWIDYPLLQTYSSKDFYIWVSSLKISWWHQHLVSWFLLQKEILVLLFAFLFFIYSFNHLVLIILKAKGAFKFQCSTHEKY